VTARTLRAPARGYGAASFEESAVADLLLRGVDELTAEQLRMIARDRNATVADVVIDLLKTALQGRAVFAETVSYRAVNEVGGDWDGNESDAFREALEAIESMPKNEGLFALAGSS
jgi:hypothetical protein